MNVRRVVATAVAVRQRCRRPGFRGLVILRGPAVTRVGLVPRSPSSSLSLPRRGKQGAGGSEKGRVSGGSGPGGASIDLTAHSSPSTSVEGRRRRLKGWVRCQHAYIQSSRPTRSSCSPVLVRRVLYVVRLK